MSREVFELAPPRLVDEPGPAGSAIRESLWSEECSSREAGAWDRLEARLESGTALWSRPGLRLALSAAAAMALVIGAGWLGWVGYLSRPQADVPAWSADEAVARAVIVPRPVPARLSTGRSVFVDGSVAVLSPGGSATQWAPGPGSTSVELSSGSVELSVTARRLEQAFEVHCAGYRFRVLGTRFRVELDRTTSRLNVTEGSVAVFAGKARMATVRTGQSWQGRRRDSVDSEQTEREQRTTANQHDAGLAADPAQDCLTLARRGLHQQALACFQRQAAGQGMAAEVAQYELARLRRNVSGDQAGALRALRDYTRRFPGGTFRTEAEVSIVELLASMGQNSQALAESERLLNTGLARERAADLRLLRAQIYHRRLGDCARAELEYARLEAASGALGAQAELGRARCLERLGRQAEAVELYRGYLRRKHAPEADWVQRRLEALTGQSSDGGA